MWITYSLIAIIVLNLPAHYFLVRLFMTYRPESKMNSPWVTYPLLIPPLAILVAGFLVSLGGILSFFEKK